VARVALITGSPGARWEAVGAELAARGWEVRRSAFQGNEQPDLAGAARGAEVVIHAGVRTPQGASAEWRAAAEAQAARGATLAARDAGARRVLLLSSALVYGRPRHLPCAEGELKRPRTAAERARWEAERAAWRAFREGAPLVVLRPVLAYGPGLRGGAIRALSLIALLHRARRRVPILRRGPVAHLVHIADIARAAAHLAEHPDDGDVVGRAFNVGDDAPLPLAEHLAAAIGALGYEAGRYLPYSPRLAAALLWLARIVPDRLLFDPVNRRLARAWHRYTGSTGASDALPPRLDRETLLWMTTDHYYDIGRLGALGWRPRYPVSTEALPDTIRALVSEGLLPAGVTHPRTGT
jgi:nucleoside-diphosphate-sugar epimerase